MAKMAHQQESQLWEVWSCMGSASSRQELGKGILKYKPLVNLLAVRGNEHQTTGQRIVTCAQKPSHEGLGLEKTGQGLGLG